jgi:hypothetical protein
MAIFQLPRGKRVGPDIAPIPAQAASTSLFSEPPMAGGQSDFDHRPRCLIEGGSAPFTITVCVNRYIDDLKNLIHEKGKKMEF